jgi:drug/metabolite transporter (DMT)-like permease
LLDLFLGALAISFSAVFMKLVAVGPTTAGFYRMLFGGALLAAWLVVRGERPSLGGARGWLLAAALAFALDLIFWHRSILEVGTGLATLLANFQVFLVALASIALLGERGGWRVAVAIPLALVGLMLIVGIDPAALAPDRQRGIAFGLATALCYAGYLLSLRQVRATGPGSPIATVATISLLSAVLLGGAVLIEGESFAIPSLADLGLLLLYGLLGQVLGWVLISRAMDRIPTTMVALVLLLQPVFAYLWDVAFFARRFTALELGGAALALLAIQLGATRRAA